MAPLLDLSRAPFDVITAVLEVMSPAERATCARVCTAWAEAAAAATHSIILRDKVQTLSCLQAWLEKHGNHLKVLQIHACEGAALNALPCAQLQDLLLSSMPASYHLYIRSTVWRDIAAATKLTAVSLSDVFTPSQQADVVSALTALPNLQQLTWDKVDCHGQAELLDSSLLQQMPQLTSLELRSAAAAALQHLGSLTKLQHLTFDGVDGWVAAGCPGLQELKALTHLDLYSRDDIPASIRQLTALQQLKVANATPFAINGLQVLTALTQLKVRRLRRPFGQSVKLQLTGLQHLQLDADGFHDSMPKSFLASCKQLRVLAVRGFALAVPGSLVSSTLLQHLELTNCRIVAAPGAARPVSWQQLFPGPGQLPHLTSLQLWGSSPPHDPEPQQSDLECMVAACCSSFQALHLYSLQDGYAPVLTRLPALTSLQLNSVVDSECGALAQLTRLRELRITFSARMTSIGLRQLAALQQLTSLEFYPACNLTEINPVLQAAEMLRLPNGLHVIVNKAPAGCPSDVPSRLLRACDAAFAAGQ